MNRTLCQRHSVWRARLQPLVLGLLIGAAIAPVPDLVRPLPAEAGIFQVLFGRRRDRGQQAPPDREQGGGLRRGQDLLGGLDPTLPYVLTPRNTYQLSDRFTIAWNPVPEAAQYRVRLWRWGDAYGEREWPIWETTTTETQVTYAGDVPLSPARFYSVQVIAEVNGNPVSSDADTSCATLGFSLLFPENQALLQADLAEVDTRALSAEEAALELASIYVRYGMLDYAITALQAPDTVPTSTALNLALGEAYHYAALTALALSHFQTALTLAQATGDDLSEAMALEGIGQIAVALALNQQTWESTTAELDPLTLAPNSTVSLNQSLALLKQSEQLYRDANAIAAADAVQYRVASLQLLQSQLLATKADDILPAPEATCAVSSEP